MAGVEFCKKCRSLLVPVKKARGVAHMKCRKCGYELKAGVRELKIKEKPAAKKGVVLLEKDEVALPTIEKACIKCDHPKSYYWLQQTRSADEPPTQFFRCVKCSHVWREYK